MSKKRTSAESNNDEQTNEGSEYLFQEEDNAKRVKLDTLSDTVLQDLPLELLECILVKAVAMEVKDMKLAKSVWKEKADLVISRLTTVCSQWSSTLTTNSFRTKLHRILDGTAQETIRLGVLHEHRIHSAFRAVTTLKDEIFLLYRISGFCGEDHFINVYDRNNMAKVKDLIQLLGAYAVWMAACHVSNCVYVGLRNRASLCSLSVLRISKDVDHRFKESPWIKDHRRCISTMSASANGSLIILSVQHRSDPKVVHVSSIDLYDANGSLQHEITLTPDICAFRFKNVIQKSNGNFVLAHVNKETHQIKLLEIDAGGSVVRQYQSSFSGDSFVNVADIYGRIMITGLLAEMELLDSEFNLLGTYRLQQDVGKSHLLYDLHYDSERNEFVRIHQERNAMTRCLTIFRFTEE